MAGPKNNVWGFLKEYFDIKSDKENEQQTIDTLKADVSFKGTRMWILICAIMICSLGLNMNSTAVIIGAMLISPLMGPIIGLGLGVGITDIELVKSSLRNFLMAVGISILTSTLYFLISPISIAQSEILARTQPTTFDLLIALFGGFAGIIAGATKSKGQVIPGVAIATALMPPLCTAGYGLGTGQLSYFLGALYLFIINAVFIALATVLTVRALGYKQVTYIDERKGKRLNDLMIFIVVCTAIPSVFLAYQMVQETYWNQRVKEFVSKEVVFDNSFILEYKTQRTDSLNYLNISLLGQEVSPEQLEVLQAKLPSYGLPKTQISIRQGYDESTKNEIRYSIISDLERSRSADNYTQFLQLQNDSLRAIVTASRAFHRQATDVNKEIAQLFEEVAKTEFAELYRFRTDTLAIDSLPKVDTVPYIKLYTDKRLSREKQEMISNWLTIRFRDPEIVFEVSK